MPVFVSRRASGNFNKSIRFTLARRWKAAVMKNCKTGGSACGLPSQSRPATRKNIIAVAFFSRIFRVPFVAAAEVHVDFPTPCGE
jgi:hypothetical protein